ncbi:unannotated protein [freshwater metagenome]|uniref:Unannotated protein n=1 Tax=freshwater metagenome TaxID=449393 RepID=A0A6J6KW36_9ZZZZ
MALDLHGLKSQLESQFLAHLVQLNTKGRVGSDSLLLPSQELEVSLQSGECVNQGGTLPNHRLEL